jgi:Fe-S-cluster containining protein
MLKSTILQIIYNRYEEWAKQFAVACRPSCCACCTQNVTITAIEGEEILRYVKQQGMEQWIGTKLSRTRPVTPPPMTTNEFARACMENRDIDLDQPANLAPCPFLENGLCQIYPVRPFGCRLFISSVTCSASQPAVVPESYLGAVTAVSQLIEHLGQKEYWGNMLDVLPALLDIVEYQNIALYVDTALSATARIRTLTAQPLPGFLLDEQEATLDRKSTRLNSSHNSESRMPSSA